MVLIDSVAIMVLELSNTLRKLSFSIPIHLNECQLIELNTPLPSLLRRQIYEHAMQERMSIYHG